MRIIHWLCLGLLLAMPTAAFGQSPTLRGLRIQAIHFQGEGLTASEGMTYVDLRPGDRFDRHAVRRSVRLLYHLGLFGQVRAIATRKDDAVVLTFHLIPKRTVLAVEFLGNQALHETDLIRLSRLSRGDEFDRWKMEAAAADILNRYRRQGYRRARIIAKAEGHAQGDVKVRYYVQEGPPTRISRIWFKGDLPFSAKRLGERMDLARGDVLAQKSLRRGIQLLRDYFCSQGYLEVRIAEPALDHELAALWEVLALEIQSGPRIEFAFSGNQVLSQQSLKREIPVVGEQVFNSYLLEDIAERLRDRYRQQGFAKVQVDFAVAWSENRKQKKITFTIDEGNRVTVREIRFEGNRAFADRTLQGYIANAMLDTIPQALINQPVDRGDLDQLGGGHPLKGKARRVHRPQGILFDLVPETVYLQEPYEQAMTQIGDLYRSHGYLSVEIDPLLLSYDASGSNLYITVPIREGPQTRVESISFQGNQEVSSNQLLEVADRQTGLVRPGAPLDLYGVEQLRKELVRTYARQGYIYCRVEHQLRFSADRSLGEVLYLVSEGQQVRVGRVLVRGQVVTDPAVFRHVVSLQAGEILSPDQMTADQRVLYSLGIFSNVDLKILNQDVPVPVKDVVVSVREHLPHSLVVSPGISSAEGVRLQLDYTHRNLFGYAVEFAGRARINYQVLYPVIGGVLEETYEDRSLLEGLEALALTGLHWPQVWLTDWDLASRVDLLFKKDLTTSFDLTKVSVIPGADLRWTENLVFTAELELEYDRLGCLGGTKCGWAALNRKLPYDEGSLMLGVLRPKISWDKRDNIFHPHRGVLMTLRTELAGNLLDSGEVFYAKLDGLATGYLPLGRQTTLALSARTGFIFGLFGFHRTPAHKLFWLGGRNTIRGFEEDLLIPTDQVNLNDPSTPCAIPEDPNQKQVCVSLGGNALLVLKAELRFPLLPGTLEGAFFVDMGNLWVDWHQFDPFDLRISTGFGIRLVTPIGPVAFDLGFNPEPDPARREPSWVFHFNIGVF